MDNKPRCTTEAAEQRAFFQWIKHFEIARPELALLHAIPNGGYRLKSEAKNLQAQGVRPGVPDLHLPIARGDYHSLYIELKVFPNKLTDHQRLWYKALNEQGNYTAVAYGWEHAAEIVERYLRTNIGPCASLDMVDADWEQRKASASKFKRIRLKNG